MSADAIRAILKDENKLNKVVKAAFDQVDTDGSGKIEFNEFKNLIKEVLSSMC